MALPIAVKLLQLSQFLNHKNEYHHHHHHHHHVPEGLGVFPLP